MAPPSIPTTLPLLLLLLLLLLPPSSAQQNPGSFDISAQQGWDNFVNEASKGTGGTPIDMKEFVTRVNGNINDGEDEEADPQLVEELKNFDRGNGSPAVDSKPEHTGEPMDNVAMARMIASAHRGSLAPANAPTSGALDVKVVGVVSVLLPAFAACFVTSMVQ